MKQPASRPRDPAARGWVRSMIAAAGLSAAWLVLCAYYIGGHIGWREVWQSSPHVIGAFLAGMFAPVVLAWLVIGIARRLAALRRTSEALQAEIERRLAHPKEPIIGAADGQAGVVRRNSFDSRRAMFLRATRFVIEDLNASAIDLNRLLNNACQQKMGLKSVEGDCGVFVRGILSADAVRARQVIREKYDRDVNFRACALRYLDHFEKLLAEANESDLENLLSSTFLSADVGKLYMLRARAVGRIN